MKPSETNPLVSVVIVTRNRCELVLQALESCLVQTYRPLEVRVYDDASEEAIEGPVLSQFPEVVFRRQSSRTGYIKLRNDAFRETTAPYVFSLDDDAYYTDPGTIATTVAMFQNDPNIGAIALPYIEPRNPDRKMTHQPQAGDALRSYVGCAHAVRRDIALALGGYREFFVHQGEERDLCIRMLDRGYRVAYGASAPLVHLYSPVRDRRRLHYYSVRNTLLFDWLNVPWPYVVPQLAGHTVRLLAYKFSFRSSPHRAYGILAGLGSCVRYARQRNPVSPAHFRQYRLLPSHGPSPHEAPDHGARRGRE